MLSCSTMSHGSHKSFQHLLKSIPTSSFHSLLWASILSSPALHRHFLSFPLQNMNQLLVSSGSGVPPLLQSPSWLFSKMGFPHDVTSWSARPSMSALHRAEVCSCWFWLAQSHLHYHRYPRSHYLNQSRVEPGSAWQVKQVIGERAKWSEQ